MSEADKGNPPANGSNPTLDSLLAELNSVKSERDNLRSAYNKRDAEISALRRQATSQTAYRPTEPQYVEEPEETRQAYDPRDIEELRFRVAKSEFLSENPQGAKRWAEINAIINDEAKAANYAAWDNRGRVNYQRVFHDIHRDLEWAEINKARQDAAANQSTASAAPSGAPSAAAAFISGVASSQGPESINIDEMTPEEMVQKGLVQFDPNDPSRHSGRSLR